MRLTNKTIAAGLLVPLLRSLAQEPGPRPWVHPPGVTRELYVSPTGAGAGTVLEPMGLPDAILNAQPGDLYWMLPGTYTGTFTFTKSGTAANAILFRSRPGDRVTIDGKLIIKGAYTWIWGLEITNPGGKVRSGEAGSVYVGAPGVHLINNVIHDTWECGIGAWNTGPGQVYYGNIVYKVGQHENLAARCYPVYAQNDFRQYSHKYFIQTMLLDVREDVGGPGYNFHAYTEAGVVTGFYLVENVFSNGRFLIGGFGIPADNEVVLSNCFYNHSVEFGYRRPTQVEFRDNYLGRSVLSTMWFWGEGETLYQRDRPNVYAGNELYFPPNGTHVMFRTSAYVGAERCEGCARISAAKIFDRNTYSAPFKADSHADGVRLSNLDFKGWQAATRDAGNAFDLESAVVSGPLRDKVALFVNEYEPGRAHLAVFNRSRASSVTADLSAVATYGSTLRISRAKDAYGVAAVSGVYTGPVAVPTGGEEFSAFLVSVQDAHPRIRPPRSRK